MSTYASSFIRLSTDEMMLGTNQKLQILFKNG